ncbi:MAG: PIN domain-containing protein [Fimbriimonadaceae bacterium]|nr:PIN domain-containing protein [Fimbriimonadaceae bacterium]
MKKLLDTSTCVAFLRKRPLAVVSRFDSADRSELVLCTIVCAELLVGGLKADDPERKIAAAREFISQFHCIPFGESEAEVYASIRHDLERAGAKTGANDLIVAATAIAGGLTLVTHNTSEFSRVDGLVLEDWED